MILLDTNVVSELMKPLPHPGVAHFIAGYAASVFFVPSLVVAELRYGVARLPVGKRRADILASFEAFLRAGFASRILPFDAACAAGYATARAAREQAGRPISMETTYLASQAAAS
jgi:predicted nucleic acid-binding protein